MIWRGNWRLWLKYSNNARRISRLPIPRSSRGLAEKNEYHVNNNIQERLSGLLYRIVIRGFIIRVIIRVTIQDVSQSGAVCIPGY